MGSRVLDYLRFVLPFGSSSWRCSDELWRRCRRLRYVLNRIDVKRPREQSSRGRFVVRCDEYRDGIIPCLVEGSFAGIGEAIEMFG